MTTPLDQLREACAKVCDDADKSAHPADLADAIRAIDLTQFEQGDKVTDEMVNRFLRWRLPEDFRPDAGISFKPDYNEQTQWPAKHEPVGTNLLTAEQARKMLEYVLGVKE